MSSCNWINTDEDVNSLLDAASGFHDSQLVDLVYRSGDRRVGNGMAYGFPEDHVLFIRFESFWYPKTLQLCFRGVRKYHIAGFQNNYFTEILDSYLAFHCDLYSGSSQRLIVWADSAGFNPHSDVQVNLMHEPMISYVVADQLCWRFIGESDDEESE